MFGEPVTATLTLGLDLFTHSLPAFRLTLGSDTSIGEDECVVLVPRDCILAAAQRLASEGVAGAE
ncbi:hypothetical protein [Streptomyces sp. NPDC004546]|uniref:hypothetical protein n=1 Tax=unclassified Streptomyces TaxID=2593676 RepID=UPI0033A6764C